MQIMCFIILISKTLVSGYKDLSDNISYLVGSVVKYNKYRIEKATIIRQYNLKTVNGMITPYSIQSSASTSNGDNKLYLDQELMVITLLIQTVLM